MDGPFISSSFVFTLTFQPDSKEGKALMLAAPYCVTDGINEAGFGAAILELEMGEKIFHAKPLGYGCLSLYS